jgi:hypothetical protein
MNRVLFLLAVPVCLLAAQPDFHLQVVPTIVYTVDDPGNSRTSSFVFDIAVICATDCELAPISASVELSNSRSIVNRQEWTTEMLAKIKGVTIGSCRILRSRPPGASLRCPKRLTFTSTSVFPR